MKSTIQETANGVGFKVNTDAKTVGGNALVIVSTPTGLYQVKAVGTGVPPKTLTEQFFTNLPLAKKAIEKYLAANASTFYKKEIQKEGIKRRQERHERALELKNGELEVPDQED